MKGYVADIFERVKTTKNEFESIQGEVQKVTETHDDILSRMKTTEEDVKKLGNTLADASETKDTVTATVKRMDSIEGDFGLVSIS